MVADHLDSLTLLRRAKSGFCSLRALVLQRPRNGRNDWGIERAKELLRAHQVYSVPEEPGRQSCERY